MRWLQKLENMRTRERSDDSVGHEPEKLTSSNCYLLCNVHLRLSIGGNPPMEVPSTRGDGGYRSLQSTTIYSPQMQTQTLNLNILFKLYTIFFIFSVFSASPKCPTDLLDIRECETLASFLAHAPCSPSWQDDAGNPAACTSTTLFHAVLGFFWMELGLPAWCWMLVSSKKSPAGRSPELLTASLSPCMVIGSVETAWAWRHAPNTSQ